MARRTRRPTRRARRRRATPNGRRRREASLDGREPPLVPRPAEPFRRAGALAARRGMRVVGVVGWKDSGKTGLVERLVAELTARGLRLATIKHAHHEADVDLPGTDSHRHRAAGAAQVILCTPVRWALMSELRGAPEPDLAALLARLDPCDLVLVEGFKRGPHPKIEAHRAATGRAPIAGSDPTVAAVASDAAPRVPCPVIHLDDTAALADLALRIAAPPVGTPSAVASP